MRNWQVLKLVCLIVVALIAGVFVIGCGSSTNTDVATTTITTVSSVTTTTVAGSATISGQVAASSADLTSSGLMALSIVEPTFRTLANTGVTGATVSLYKIEADGTETDTGKIATTDASGNYSLTEVDVLTSGIYKTVAQKVVGGNTVEVSSLVVLSGASAETVNIAPETTIATEMFDGVIKDQFSTLTVDQGTMAELKNLVVDDTENLVNNDLLTLPSMSTTNKTQVDAAAGGIAENNGNAEKAFQKLRLENLGQSAITENDANKAAKYINEIILNGAGTGYLIPREITEAFAQAFLNGTSKTVAEVITAVDEAVTGTALNSSNIITSFGTRLQEIKTQYDGLTVGLSDEALTQPEYLVFDAANPLVITASATLDVGQQIALKNFIAANFLSPGQAIDNTTFASNLGYLSATGVSTSTPFFEDVNLYYGSYGGWKVGGTTQIFTPAGSTVESVTLLSASGTTVVTLSADGTNVYRLSNSDGPVVTAGTNRFTLAALLTDTSTITTPVTVEMVGIPEPSVTLIDGTAIANPGDPIQYYQLTNVGERKPVFCWSTTEVGSVAIPAGYSWAYTTEITVYGATSGATTLEVDPDTGRLSLSDTERATMEYSSLSDLGALYTNNSFISPITFLSELNSQPVAYRFYLQRILLNDQGKFNGIAAGNFTFMRYAP